MMVRLGHVKGSRKDESALQEVVSLGRPLGYFPYLMAVVGKSIFE